RSRHRVLFMKSPRSTLATRIESASKTAAILGLIFFSTSDFISPPLGWIGYYQQSASRYFLPHCGFVSIGVVRKTRWLATFRAPVPVALALGLYLRICRTNEKPCLLLLVPFLPRVAPNLLRRLVQESNP